MINNDPNYLDLQVTRMQRDSYQHANWEMQTDLDWHKNAVSQLRDHLKQIRFFMQSNKLLENIEITVREARLFDVCRVCKKPVKASVEDPFVLNYGDEFAHKSCLEGNENVR